MIYLVIIDVIIAIGWAIVCIQWGWDSFKHRKGRHE